VKCIIIDDEISVIDSLKDLISRLPFLKVVKSFTNPFEGLKFIQEKSIDLVFLDVEMPVMNGIELIKSLVIKPQIIFMANSNKFAIYGFELDATDFLIKPLCFDRLLRAVNKAGNIQKIFDQQYEKTVAPHKKSAFDFILVKSGCNTLRINLNDILFCEGLKDYIKIHTPGKTIVTLNSLKKFEELLPEDHFVRVHKSFIVPLSKIDAIQHSRIVIGKSMIPIGDNYKSLFNQKILAVNV
jgi:two-component system, LytTR family, response regulator